MSFNLNKKKKKIVLRRNGLTAEGNIVGRLKVKYAVGKYMLRERKLVTFV